MSAQAPRISAAGTFAAHVALAVIQCLGLAMFAGPLAAIHGFSLDDAWIHQVVARTFAHTGTLGYAAGHQGGGATSYLWAAVLATNYRLFHADPVTFTRAINLALTLLAGQCLLVLVRRAARGHAPLGALVCVAVVALATFGGNFMWFAFSGMEATLFVTLSLATLAFWDSEGARTEGTSALAGTCAGLLACTRPEGALLGPLLIASTWRRRRSMRDAALLVVPWALALAMCVGANVRATGSPWPATLAGRRWLWLGDSGLDRLTQVRLFGYDWLEQLKEYTLGTSSHLAFWLSVGCAGVGLLRVLLSASNSLRLLVAWSLVHLAAYAVMLPVLGHGGRYQPLTPVVYLLLAGVGAVDLVQGLLAAVAANRLSRLPPAVGAVVALAPWAGLVGVGVRDWRGDHTKAVSHMHATEVALGPLIDALPPNARVASFDIGASGFFAHRTILDLGGLVDPGFVPQMSSGRTWEYLRDHLVDYVVLPRGYLPPTVPDAIDFGQRLHLFDNPALSLTPVRMLQTEPSVWIPAIRCTSNAAPTQMIFQVSYTGLQGPRPDPGLGRGGSLEDPAGRLGLTDREVIEHGLRVLSGYGLDVRVVLDDARGASTTPQGRWQVQIGRWGVRVTPPLGSTVPAEASTGLASEWTWLPIDAGAFGSAVRLTLHAIAAAQRRFADARFSPALPPASAVPSSPHTAPDETTPWGVPLAALMTALGSAGVRRRLGRLAWLPAALLALACARRLPDVALDGDSAVRGLLDDGHAPVDDRVDGKTALHVAAERGDARTVRALLEHHASIAALDPAGDPALTLAARRGKTDCVDALLAAGADPNQPSAVTETRPLHAAVASGNAETIERLLQGGADPDARSTNGETALHVAARQGPAERSLAIRSLLDRGTNPRARDARGFTALHVGAANDAPDVVRAYRDRHVDLNDASAWGQTALDIALEHGMDRAADALIAAGARTLSTRDPLPPLHDAARMNDVTRLARLLAAGADRDQTYDGKTASDVALESSSGDALLLLRATTPARTSP